MKAKYSTAKLERSILVEGDVHPLVRRDATILRSV